MGGAHIFRCGPWQPLIRHWCLHREKFVHVNPRKIYHCHECYDRRQARSLEVSIDYDRIRIRCKGGKHPGWN